MPDYKEPFLPIDKMMRTDIMITTTVMVPVFNLNYMDGTSFMDMATAAHRVKGAVGVSEAKVISYVGIISTPFNLIIISAALEIFLMLALFTISFQPHTIATEVVSYTTTQSNITNKMTLMTVANLGKVFHAYHIQFSIAIHHIISTNMMHPQHTTLLIAVHAFIPTQ